LTLLFFLLFVLCVVAFHAILRACYLTLGERAPCWRNSCTVSVKLHLRDGQTDKETRLCPSVRPSTVRSFVSLSVVSARGVHPMGGTNRDEI